MAEGTGETDTSRPRLAPTTEDDWDDDTRALLDRLNRYNIFTTLAHHPDLLRRWLTFGGHVLVQSTLPPRPRELAILRVGWRCGSAYEFGQHTVLGRSVGLTDDEIQRVATAEPLTGGRWSDEDAEILRAADELVSDFVLSDETWAALAARWSTQQVLDLIFTVGQYVLVSMALNTLGVELDAGLPGFPEEDAP